MILGNDLVENFLIGNPDGWFSVRTIYEILSKRNLRITNILQVHGSIRTLSKHNKLLFQETFNADTHRNERLIKWKT